MAEPVGILKRNLTSSTFPVRAFYKEEAAFTSAVFVERVFVNQAAGHPLNGKNFQSSAVKLINDGGNDLFYSFDGVTTHGRLGTGETLDTNNIRRSEWSIFLRAPAVTSYRLEIW
jgi:hypothetical protein